MPGVVGFTRDPDREIWSAESLTRMRESIKHKEFYVDDELFCNDRVCCSRTHINIIQTKPQPYCQDGIYVWLDGEFYNQDVFCSGFGADPCTDAELLFRLYNENKDWTFLRSIDGFFSAVIFDANQNRLHLISDRYGLRYLYWTVQDGHLAWASELKAFINLPGYQPKIDPEAVGEFFHEGWLLADRTWFEGISLVSPATVLIWDLDQRTLTHQRYWDWSEIKELTGRIDEDEVAEELGGLFKAAVTRRSRVGERVGLTLSGGLDSRAILAAMPDRGYPIHAITFGVKGCDDITIAARAARVRGVVHHVVEITTDRWLAPRFCGIWWTDGQLSLMHMHGIEGQDPARKFFDIQLNGFLGDALLGGSYLDYSDDDILLSKNRGRRFVANGPRLGQVYYSVRKPFFDNTLMEFTVSIPRRLRKNSYIYKKMLMKYFLEFYQFIPWQKTGMPIGCSAPRVTAQRFVRKVKNLYRQEAMRLGLSAPRDTRNYTDYPNWIRRDPARRVFEDILQNRSALYTEYVPAEKVRAALSDHLSGADCAAELCQYLTFEIWLQQVFEGRFRGNA